MLKETLSRYLTSYVTSLDLHHLAVTLCLSDQQASHYGSIIRTVMSRTIGSSTTTSRSICAALPAFRSTTHSE